MQSAITVHPATSSGRVKALFLLCLTASFFVPFLAQAQDQGESWVIVHAGTLLAVPGRPAERERKRPQRSRALQFADLGPRARG